MSFGVVILLIVLFGVFENNCGDWNPCDTDDTGIYPHPEECQLFFNCSLKAEEFKPWLGDHVMECEYPDLFRDEGSNCEPFEKVFCGQRKELGHACEYRSNLCEQELCAPCRSDFTCTDRHGNCEYTNSAMMKALVCPRDEKGHVKVLDASICSF